MASKKSAQKESVKLRVVGVPARRTMQHTSEDREPTFSVSWTFNFPVVVGTLTQWWVHRDYAGHFEVGDATPPEDRVAEEREFAHADADTLPTLNQSVAIHFPVVMGASRTWIVRRDGYGEFNVFEAVKIAGYKNIIAGHEVPDEPLRNIAEATSYEGMQKTQRWA